ncbi:25458_t:CDS:2 [Gigaspora rosea]|nr:25458_t:CDS:2 [Gigaspora rosea]
MTPNQEKVPRGKPDLLQTQKGVPGVDEKWIYTSIAAEKTG